jgi:hypothetical protein
MSETSDIIFRNLYSLHLFQLSCETSDIIFNLLKVLKSSVEVEERLYFENK